MLWLQSQQKLSEFMSATDVDYKNTSKILDIS